MIRILFIIPYPEMEQDIRFVLKEYPCNEIFILNNESLLDIGNGDIIINHEFKSNGGIINYPFKSFTIPENDNEFNKLKGKFEIKDIEIYIVYDLNFL